MPKPWLKNDLAKRDDALVTSCNVAETDANLLTLSGIPKVVPYGPGLCPLWNFVYQPEWNNDIVLAINCTDCTTMSLIAQNNFGFTATHDFLNGFEENGIGSFRIDACILYEQTWYLLFDRTASTEVTYLTIEAVLVAPSVVPFGGPSSFAGNASELGLYYSKINITKTLGQKVTIQLNIENTEDNAAAAIYVSSTRCPTEYDFQYGSGAKLSHSDEWYWTRTPNPTLYFGVWAQNTYYTINITTSTVGCAVPSAESLCGVTYPTYPYSDGIVQRIDDTFQETENTMIVVYGKTCTLAYKELYCAQNYPRCDNNNFPLDFCQTDCDGLATACFNTPYDNCLYFSSQFGTGSDNTYCYGVGAANHIAKFSATLMILALMWLYIS